MGDRILQRLSRYTREHFIPPFNAITQDMVTVLTSHGTRFIHSFDHALRVRDGRSSHPSPGSPFGGFLEDMVLSSGAVFIVSEWQKTYNDAENVILEQNGSQICLHWYYDSKKDNYVQAYRGLAAKLKSV